MAAMDIAFKVNNDARRALADIKLYGTLAFAAYLAFAVVRYLIEHFWLKPAAQAKAAQSGTDNKKQDAAGPCEPVLSELLEARRQVEAANSGIIAER